MNGGNTGRQRRDIVDVALDFLRFIEENYDHQERIRISLSYYRVYRKYMNLFLQSRLVIIDRDKYIVTDKGREFIELIKILKKMIGEDSSSDTIKNIILSAKETDLSTYKTFIPKKIYIGSFLGKARSIYDIIACILYNSISPTSKTRAMVKCGLNINQFSKYLHILTKNDLIKLNQVNGKTELMISSRGIIYLLIYRRIVSLLAQR